MEVTDKVRGLFLSGSFISVIMYNLKDNLLLSFMLCIFYNISS